MEKGINRLGLLLPFPDYLINIKSRINNPNFDYGKSQANGRPLKCQNRPHSVHDDKDFYMKNWYTKEWGCRLLNIGRNIKFINTREEDSKQNYKRHAYHNRAYISQVFEAISEKGRHENLTKETFPIYLVTTRKFIKIQLT